MVAAGVAVAVGVGGDRDRDGGGDGDRERGSAAPQDPAAPEPSDDQDADDSAPDAPAVDQPAECTIDARELEAAEGHPAGTYNTVELREPMADEDLVVNYPICWYSHDGTAFPSTTMITAPYGMAPADESSALAVMSQATNAEETDAALAGICPVDVQRTDYDNVLICGLDAFVFGPTRWYQDADLIQENSIDDDVNTLSDEELQQIDPVLSFLSSAAE